MSQHDDPAKLADRLLVRQIQVRLDEKADAIGVASLLHEERVVYLAFWAKHVIDNGGFPYFLQGSHSLLETSGAFQELGLGDAADACRNVAALFGDRVPSKDTERLSIAGENKALVDRESERVWDTPVDDIETAALQYILRHREAFGLDVA